MKAFLQGIALGVSVLLSMHSQAQAVRPNAAPINPEATPAARGLLQEIDSVSGHATLSGQHNYPNTVSRYSDRIYELTGHYPAVFGQDFGFSGGEDKDSTLSRAAMIEEVIRQYRRGSVIALTWHSVRPTEDEPVTFRDNVLGHLTDWEFRQVLTPGSDLYKRWARQVDVIAGYLQELQAAGVPVLFRPYYEMNGNWFWWGGRPGPDGTSALYRQIFDRFVHQKHLNNLIWVWNVNAPSVNAGPVDQYFPGSAYVDVVSMDIYGSFEKARYDSMIALAGDTKPIALAEVGAMPSLETLASQPRWAYMMMWSGMAESSNSPAQLQAVFHAPNVVDRGDPRLPAPLPLTATPQPSDPEATMGAKQLLEKLSSARSSGAEVAEFSVDVSSTSALADQVRAASKTGRLPILRWTPPSPAGEGMAAPLSDFEWYELVKPGTALHDKWLAEIDTVVPLLQQLDKEHVAVAWSPLPEANAHTFWWGVRPGPEGSRALLREIAERLTSHGLHNLVWIWEPAVSSTAPSGPDRAPIQDLYPGPLGVDAILLDVDGDSATHGFAAGGVEALAGIKPVGLRSSAPLAKAALPVSLSWIYTLPPTATH